MKRIVALLATAVAAASCSYAFSTIGSWSIAAPPPTPITTNNIVSLADGRVAIFGGQSLLTGNALNQTLLYDPATDSWKSGAPMPGPGYPDVVLRLRDGTVLVEGGQDPTTNGISGATWIYDPGRNAWSRADSVLEPRGGPSFALLTDGRVLIAGGGVPLAQPIQNPDGSVSNYQNVETAEIFDPVHKSWSRAGSLHSARNAATLVPLPGGGALDVGGCVGTSGYTPPTAVAEVFDSRASSWTRTTSIPKPVCGATGIALRDGRALVVETGIFVVSGGSAFLYDPISRIWTTLGSLTGGGSTAITLGDGRVLVPEVQEGTPKGRVFMDNVGGQIFDPATGQWSYATTTSVPLSVVFLGYGQMSFATALPNGNAVILLPTVSLVFHPFDAPAGTQVLDSTGLTTVLLVIAVVTGLLMLLAYRRAGRIDVGKLA